MEGGGHLSLFRVSTAIGQGQHGNLAVLMIFPAGAMEQTIYLLSLCRPILVLLHSGGNVQ